MSVWKKPISLEALNATAANTVHEILDIRFTEIGDDFLVASMPVSPRCHQAFGLLHGGVSVVLAESVGSFAGYYAAHPGYYCLGLEVNANHLNSISEGLLIARANPIHIGGKNQVWSIVLKNEQDKTICVSRLTLAVLKSSKDKPLL